MTLSIKKPLFDKAGNVNMLIRHYGYDITISSRKDNNNLKAVLERFGDLVEFKPHHIDFAKSKKFDRRCYNLRLLSVDIWDDSVYDEGILYKWFIRHENIEDSFVKELLAGKHQLYIVRVTISKYGVGLATIATDDEDSYFNKVTTFDKVSELTELINCTINQAYDSARTIEDDVFSSSFYMDSRSY